MLKPLFTLIGICLFSLGWAQESIPLAVLKYKGGGDWYANPSAVTNLIRFVKENANCPLNDNYDVVEVGSSDLFLYPWVHMTGHGNVVFDDQEAENLRNYLLGGGFLHVDDNYGMDIYFRNAMKKVFPELNWVELPFDHPIYHQAYDFDQGPPKVHAHDNLPAQGWALLHQGRVMVFYTYQADLGDGWEDPQVHQDPEELRQKALQMGLNIIQYAFSYPSP